MSKQGTLKLDDQTQEVDEFYDPFAWPDVPSTPRPQEESLGNPIDLTKLLAKQPRAKQVSHTTRTRRWAEKQGWIITPCEMKDTYFNGEMSFQGKKHDLFGLFDMIAIDPIGKRIVGVQIVSASLSRAIRYKNDEVKKHLRKMCSPDRETKSCSPFVDNLRAWLATGNVVLILEWEQRQKVGSQEWFENLHWVTEDTIREVEARRRNK